MSKVPSLPLLPASQLLWHSSPTSKTQQGHLSRGVK